MKSSVRICRITYSNKRKEILRNKKKNLYFKLLCVIINLYQEIGCKGLMRVSLITIINIKQAMRCSGKETRLWNLE